MRLKTNDALKQRRVVRTPSEYGLFHGGEFEGNRIYLRTALKHHLKSQRAQNQSPELRFSAEGHHLRSHADDTRRSEHADVAIGVVCVEMEIEPQ
jgi:hypothetical protein